MERVPRRDRLTQLGLFCERVAVPQWRDLSEATRAEAVKLLAQLLREARRAESAAHSAGGAGDE
jgi:hypothetical protein